MKIYIITSLLIFVGVNICNKIKGIILTKEQIQKEEKDAKKELKNMAITNEDSFIRRSSSFFVKHENLIDNKTLNFIITLVVCFIPILRILVIGYHIADILLKIKNKHNNKII